MTHAEIPAPSGTDPDELPVSRMRAEIEAAIRSHQLVIVAGETGSGKTTQLPKIALGMGRERIAHTQPRRIAARTIAERIAEELGDELGGLVGYQVRFTDRVSERTRIRLMTDGILLNAIHRDRELRAYDTIIIDEAHERSLNIDFLLGYLKTLLPRRPDLKVIITSATIDPESFAAHFADPVSGAPAPIIQVPGRTFPVEIRYRPLVPEESESRAVAGTPVQGVADRGATGGRRPASAPSAGREPRDLFEAIGDAVQELARENPGDVLVFLSGEAEIRDAADALTGRYGGNPARPIEVLPLYGRLSAAEQHRVFERGRPGARRIVLATNVAETSLTVPGIRSVIDAGTARISRYNSRSKVQRLPIEPVSRASAMQRSGRSGRTSPGIAIRLYSEEDFDRRPEFTEPEILRTGLASVILQMLSLGLGEIAEFPFLTPPDSRGIADGVSLLTELGAVRPASPDGRGRGRGPLAITRTGREIARLPIEPRFARMVIESRRHGVARAVIAVVAGLTVQDVRERPAEARGRADELHARFTDPTGDILTLVNLWTYLQREQRDRSSSSFRRMCRAEHLNFLRVREWMDLVRQLERIVRPGEEMDGAETAPNPEAIHRSVLAGLLSHLGMRDERGSANPARGRGAPARGAGADAPGRRAPAREYLGSRGTRFALHPGSVLARRPPEVVMSVELVETSRLFARMNAAVDPAWAEELAGPLAKRQLGEPRWERRQGSAVADERVTLFGVPIVARRRVRLSREDPALAREFFIRHALVDGEWDPPAPHAFERANRRLRRELEQAEERTRRREHAPDDEEIFDFFAARIPPEITSAASFESWWREARERDPDLLTLRRADLVPVDAAPIDEAAFPRSFQHGDQTLSLRYRFDPAASDDGVTVAVPLPLLPRLSPAEFEKLVPGLREELVTGLIRTLPKSIRRHVVPAADWARTLLADIGDRLDAGGGELTALLAAEIRRRTSLRVEASDFDATRLPAHLTPTFRLIDGAGRTVDTGKDLAQLQAAHREAAAAGVARVARGTGDPGPPSGGAENAAAPSALERRGAQRWEFGDLPRHVDTPYAGGRRGGGVVRAYPALVDRRTSVDLVLVADAEEQARLSRRGVRRLLALSSPSPASYIREHLSNDEKLLLAAGPYRSLDLAIADVSLAVADRAIRRRAPDGLVWTETDFERIANDYAAALIDDIYAAIALTARVLEASRRARRAIDAASSLHVLGQLAGAAAQLDALVFDGFVSLTGLERLPRLPVYLDAVTHRMGELAAQPGRDRTRQNEVDRAVALFLEAGGELPLRGEVPERIVRVRWMLEELRVSLFAQHLRTAEPVSLTRVQRALALP